MSEEQDECCRQDLGAMGTFSHLDRSFEYLCDFSEEQREYILKDLITMDMIIMIINV